MMTPPISYVMYEDELELEPSWYNLTRPVFICFFLDRRFSSISPRFPEGSSKQSQVLCHFRFYGIEAYIGEAWLSIQYFFLLYKSLVLTRFHRIVLLDDNLQSSVIGQEGVSCDSTIENPSDFCLSEDFVCLKSLKKTV